MNRISKKKVYETFRIYQVKTKVNGKKELWESLDYWSIYEREGKWPYKWKNEIKFKSNKEIYNYLKLNI